MKLAFPSSESRSEWPESGRNEETNSSTWQSFPADRVRLHGCSLSSFLLDIRPSLSIPFHAGCGHSRWALFRSFRTPKVYMNLCDSSPLTLKQNTFFSHTLSWFLAGSWIISLIRIPSTLIPVFFVDRIGEYTAIYRTHPLIDNWFLSPGRRPLIIFSLIVTLFSLALLIASIMIGDSMKVSYLLTLSIGKKSRNFTFFRMKISNFALRHSKVWNFKI